MNPSFEKDSPVTEFRGYMVNSYRGLDRLDSFREDIERIEDPFLAQVGTDIYNHFITLWRCNNELASQRRTLAMDVLPFSVMQGYLHSYISQGDKGLSHLVDRFCPKFKHSSRSLINEGIAKRLVIASLLDTYILDLSPFYVLKVSDSERGEISSSQIAEQTLKILDPEREFSIELRERQKDAKALKIILNYRTLSNPYGDVDLAKVLLELKDPTLQAPLPGVIISGIMRRLRRK